MIRDSNQLKEENQVQEIDKLALYLQPYYSKFDVANRLLFTGHGHQAWPNETFQVFKEYEELVTTKVDHKWEDVYATLQKLRGYLKEFYDDPNGQYCREGSTHYLTVAWLSSLDLKTKPKIVTTNGEFNSLYRQLELYSIHKVIELVKVEVEPVQTLSSRLIEQVDDRTSAVICSRIFFLSGKRNKNISELAQGCRDKNSYLLIDDYHGTNVVPLSLQKQHIEDIFMVIGGYKYMQWGQGLCFLRYPKSYKNTPVVSGWMSSFGSLKQERVDGKISFDEGENRFCSGTFDSISIFRAAKVIDFFRKHKLTPEVLNKQYISQCAYLRRKFKQLNLKEDQLRLLHDEPAENFGGFVAIWSPKADKISTKLQQLDVFQDCRGKVIRLGLAPYISASQIDKCLSKIQEAVKAVFETQ